MRERATAHVKFRRRRRRSIGRTNERGWKRGNIGSRVIGATRLNAPSIRLMPGHGGLIVVCKSQGGPSHIRIINGLTCRSMPIRPGRRSRIFQTYSNSPFPNFPRNFRTCFFVPDVAPNRGGTRVDVGLSFEGDYSMRLPRIIHRLLNSFLIFF